MKIYIYIYISRCNNVFVKCIVRNSWPITILRDVRQVSWIYLRTSEVKASNRTKLVRFCKFSHKLQDTRAIANQIVIILSFAETSIPLWPANLLFKAFYEPVLLQYSCLVLLRLAYFSVSRTRIVRLISFMTRRGKSTF